MKEGSLNQNIQKEIHSKMDENKNSISQEFIKEESSINLPPGKRLMCQKYFLVKIIFFV